MQNYFVFLPSSFLSLNSISGPSSSKNLAKSLEIAIKKLKEKKSVQFHEKFGLVQKIANYPLF